MILSLFVYKINKQKEEMPILFPLCTVFLYSCDQIHIIGVVLIMVDVYKRQLQAIAEAHETARSL